MNMKNLIKTIWECLTEEKTWYDRYEEEMDYLGKGPRS